VDDTIVLALPNVPPLGNDSLTAPIDTATSPSKIIAPPTITAAQPTEMNSAPFTASTALPTTHHAHITDSQQIEVSIAPLNSHNPCETVAPPTRTTMQPCATDAEPSTASTLPTLANHTCKHNAAPTAASHNACECIAATTSTAMQPSVMDAMPFTAHTALPPVHIELHSENKDVAHTLAAPSPVHECTNTTIAITLQHPLDSDNNGIPIDNLQNDQFASLRITVKTPTGNKSDAVALVEQYIYGLTCCFDMGWQQCASGHNYNSMSGQMPSL